MNNVTLLHGDCLELLPTLPAQSVDLVLADLPYGTTQAAWDSVIPLDKLWKEYKRLLKPRGAVVLTAAQPFTSALVASNPNWFKYQDVWDKKLPVGHLNARKMPLRRHEDVLVFSPATLGNFTYNPQMRTGQLRAKGGGNPNAGQKRTYGAHLRPVVVNDQYYPTSIIEITNANQSAKLHPNQKPVALGAYLVRTYSNPGDVVLDNTMGSGSFGVAAVQEGRAFIGIEQDRAYYETACARIAAVDPLFQEVAS